MASQTLRTLKLSLLADVSQFGRELDKAGSSFNKFSKGVESAAKVATGVVGALGAIAVSSINAASDLEETGAAIEQVFGPRAAQQLQQFARGAAQSLGQSRQQALSAAQTFGIFGTSAGLADDELVDFTTNLVTLAGDLASFNNTDVDTAITALGAALRGESEPIRQYGVLLDAATLKNRALAEGIIETTEEALTPQQRTLAAYAEILAQTSLQQGDFARTSDGLANSQRVLQAEIENFRVELGQQLLPVVQELLPLIRGWVDNITAVDPARLVGIAEGVAKIATAIIGLNAALKAFAAVQAAWKAVSSVAAGVATGAVGASAAVGAGAIVGGAVGAQALSESLTPEQSARVGGVLSGGRVVPAAPAPAGNRLPGNVRTATGGSRTVVVNGIVGSPYQVFRELERIDAAGRRSSTSATLGRR